MAATDPQQQRMLERLRRAGSEPVTLVELRVGGIDFPAAVLSELELNGYAIERVHDGARFVGVRLLEAELVGGPPPRRSWPWSRRKRPASPRHRS